MVTVDETPAGSDGPSTSDVMHIGEVAARTDLSLRSLRHWHEVGLLVPSGRTDGGFRLYTETDVEKILVIRRMKPLGFSLEEMTQAMRALEALRERPDDADARAHLTAVADEARDRRTRLATQLAMADEFIDLLTEEIADA